MELERFYIFPAEVINLQVKPKYTSDIDVYKSEIMGIIKPKYKSFYSCENFKEDLVSATLQYGFKRITLYAHKYLFDFGKFQCIGGRRNPNQSLLMIDHFGVYATCTSGHGCEFYDWGGMVPECIDYGRYVFHTVRDFFELDFLTYIKEREKDPFWMQIKEKNLSMWRQIFDVDRIRRKKRKDQEIESFEIAVKLFQEKIDGSTYNLPLYR